MRRRSGVILLEDGKVALIERVREGRIYYTFPGGGIEPGETPEEAAVREAHEELGLHVRLDQLAAVVRFRGSSQYYFLATAIGGEFGTGRGEEFTAKRRRQRGTYTPVWVPISELTSRDVRPRGLAERLAREDWRRLKLPLRIEEWVRHRRPALPRPRPRAKQQPGGT